MNIFQRIKEVKLPFFAVVAALVFGGIVAPANATVYASNPGSVADPARSYSYTQPLSLDANGQATIDLPANNNRLALSFNYYLSQTQSNALAGKVLTFEFSLVKTGTSNAGQIYVPNPILTNNNQNVAQTGSGSSATATWPSGASATTSAQRITFWPYQNGTIGAAGNYTVTFKAKFDGQDLAVSNGSTFDASAEIGASGATSATVPAGATLKDIKSGKVCVDPSLIAAGDVLTARAVVDSVVISSVGAFSSSFWRNPTSTVGSSTNQRTVASSDVASGIAFDTTLSAYSIGSAGGTIPSGASFTFDLSISNSSNVEVTYPCPSLTPQAPVVTASSNTAITATTSNATECRVGVRVGSFFQPAGFAQVVNNSCTVTPFGPTFGVNTYVVLAQYTGFWGSVESTGNPTVTINANGTTSSGGGGSGSNLTPPSSSNNAAVQRPLPQISFATNPAPGFSVRPTSDTRKGTLTLQGENFSDLTAITIGGKKADFTVKDGKLEIKLPAGVTGFPEVVMTNGGGSITMQNAIEIVENKVQKLTRFVGDRFTKAGLEVLENACIDNKEATSIEAIVVVAADATEADYANAVKAATDAATYLDKVSKRIAHTSVTVVKTGTAGSKPVVEMNFTKQ